MTTQPATSHQKDLTIAHMAQLLNEAQGRVSAELYAALCDTISDIVPDPRTNDGTPHAHEHYAAGLMSADYPMTYGMMSAAEGADDDAHPDHTCKTEECRYQ